MNGTERSVGDTIGESLRPVAESEARWRRYCELKAAAMEQEARHYYAEAEAALENPHADEEERKAAVAHYLDLAKSYRYEHATFWHNQGRKVAP
jgi:hypothetical protein